MLNWTVEMERQMMLEASKRMPQEQKEQFLRTQAATPEQMASALELHQAKITYLQGREISKMYTEIFGSYPPNDLAKLSSQHGMGRFFTSTLSKAVETKIIPDWAGYAKMLRDQLK